MARMNVRANVVLVEAFVKAVGTNKVESVRRVKPGETRVTSFPPGDSSRLCHGAGRGRSERVQVAVHGAGFSAESTPMNEERVTDINAPKDEIFTTLFAMDGPMAHPEMIEEKW